MKTIKYVGNFPSVSVETLGLSFTRNVPVQVSEAHAEILLKPEPCDFVLVTEDAKPVAHSKKG